MLIRIGFGWFVSNLYLLSLYLSGRSSERFDLPASNEVRLVHIGLVSVRIFRALWGVRVRLASVGLINPLWTSFIRNEPGTSICSDHGGSPL
jgi:hypothetical protein